MLSNTMTCDSRTHRRSCQCSERHSAQRCCCSLILGHDIGDLQWSWGYSFQVSHRWCQSTGSRCLRCRYHNILDSGPGYVRCRQISCSSRSHRKCPPGRSWLCGPRPPSGERRRPAVRSGWTRPCCGSAGGSCATPRSNVACWGGSPPSLGSWLSEETSAACGCHSL